MIEFTLEEISPAEAQRILTEHDEAVRNNEINNRGRKVVAIRKYAADQGSGRWYAETGETLKFETHDKVLRGRNLLDGQNRLAACVQSGVPLKIYVARGVAREAFAYIDGGEKRTLRDVLLISREPDADNLSRALNWLCQWDSELHKLVASPVTTQRAKNLLESDPLIHKSVTKAKQLKESGLLGVGMGAFLHRVFMQHDQAEADRFIAAIATGARLEESNPFFMLRQKLIENKGSRRKFPQRDIVALAIKAWNVKTTGRPMKLLKFDHKREEMPAIEAVEAKPVEMTA